MIAPHDYIILVRVLVDLAKMVPEGPEKVHAWFVGRKILVAGPPAAGKTTFRNYLREGYLGPEQKKRSPTPKVDAGKSFSVKPVQNTPLAIEVRAIIDVPGQHLAEQIEAFEDHRPDAIVLILDGSMSMNEKSFQPDGYSLKDWVERYCEHLADILQRDRKLADNLSHIFAVLNKKDKTTVAELQAREEEVRSIFSARLRRGWGAKIDDIEFFHISSVQNPDGSTSIDDAIRQIARKLKDE